MSASAGFSMAIRNAIGDAIITQFGGGTKLQMYTSPRPANGAAITTQVKLSEHTGATPYAPATSGAVITGTLPSNVNAAFSGTCTWARRTTSGGTFLEDVDVTVAGGGGGVIVNSTSFVAGIAVIVQQDNHTIGNPGI
jgi:hypothetical protein